MLSRRAGAAVVTVLLCVVALNIWILSGSGGGGGGGGGGTMGGVTGHQPRPDPQHHSALLDGVVHGLEARVAELLHENSVLRLEQRNDALRHRIELLEKSACPAPVPPAPCPPCKARAAVRGGKAPTRTVKKRRSKNAPKYWVPGNSFEGVEDRPESDRPPATGLRQPVAGAAAAARRAVGWNVSTWDLRNAAAALATASSSEVDICGLPAAASPLPDRDCSNLTWFTAARHSVTRHRDLLVDPANASTPAGRLQAEAEARERFMCPFPEPLSDAAAGGWKNFTVAEARALLRGKTVVISGDSTSRRLNNALCNFLLNNLTSYVHLLNQEGGISPAKRTRDGDGCCATARSWPINCNHPAVTKKMDIMLRFSPNEHYDSLANFAAPRYLAEQASLRNTTADIAGGPNRDWLNTILNASLPPSKRPRAVHFFSPAAASWHVHVTHYQKEEFLDPRETRSAHGAACQELSVAALTTDEQPEIVCPFARQFTEVPAVLDALADAAPDPIRDAELGSTAAACAVTAAFCARFMDGAREARTRTGLQGGDDQAAALFFGHGFSNALSYPSGYSEKRFLPANDWQATVAHALNPRTRDEACGAIFPNERQSHHIDGIHCQYMDQTELLRVPGTFTERAECAPGEDKQGLHVYNEYAQLMRIQLLLNSIRRAEAAAGS